METLRSHVLRGHFCLHLFFSAKQWQHFFVKKNHLLMAWEQPGSCTGPSAHSVPDLPHGAESSAGISAQTFLWARRQRWCLQSHLLRTLCCVKMSAPHSSSFQLKRSGIWLYPKTHLVVALQTGSLKNHEEKVFGLRILLWLKKILKVLKCLFKENNFH